MAYERLVAGGLVGAAAIAHLLWLRLLAPNGNHRISQPHSHTMSGYTEVILATQQKRLCCRPVYNVHYKTQTHSQS